MLNDGFELTPNYMNRLDMSTYLNDGEIEHVEMEEKTLTSINDEDEQTKVRIYCIACLRVPPISRHHLDTYTGESVCRSVR